MGHSVLARSGLAFGTRTTIVLRPRTVQGKPVARRRRKARDLDSLEAARPPGRRRSLGNEVQIVKANLARFTTAIALLASIALSLGAGIRWDW